jgi:hypothetical protein
MIGVAGIAPVETSAVASCEARGVATVASAATFWCWKMLRGVMSRPALRARLTSWMELMLSPPRSKKLSSMPTCGQVKDLCEEGGQDLLLRGARCADALGA